MAAQELAGVFFWMLAPGSFQIGSDLLSPIYNYTNRLSLFDGRRVLRPFRGDIYERTAPNDMSGTPIPIPMPIIVRQNSGSAQLFPGIDIEVVDPDLCETQNTLRWRGPGKPSFADMRQEIATRIAEASRSVPMHTAVIRRPTGIVVSPRPAPAPPVTNRLSGAAQANARAGIRSLAPFGAPQIPTQRDANQMAAARSAITRLIGSGARR